ncbi:transmembrane emp24 domain-containing protein p24delta4-like [Andrographis paniculata]|uniref:transmembrane emp24 domain-containing protein p24delta4-like n=1 Tax=Andrographis paniculata TaxID=175694 RepID=UPI0021E6F2C3|nr:transmembrane emp24 domain-containing protein p24delta4-like [Andrographis paniculata]XP_051124365.1 transmembrane emp24 domain-containing protein p24delta4-like [Andrographis paniculata]
MAMIARRFCPALLILVATAAAWFPAARGVWFDMPKSGWKCVSEELQSNVVVIGEYYGFFGNYYDENSTAVPSLSVKVSSPFGNTLHQQHKVYHGQFSFTTSEYGVYMACFTIDSDTGGRTTTVGVDWKTGIATKDWDSIAKKEKIQGLDLELKKLEASVEAIHNNLFRLIEKEWKLRDMSDKTNVRVARYSQMSLSLCIVVSIVQVLYLRRYFRMKKLI